MSELSNQPTVVSEFTSDIEQHRGQKGCRQGSGESCLTPCASESFDALARELGDSRHFVEVIAPQGVRVQIPSCASNPSKDGSFHLTDCVVAGGFIDASVVVHSAALRSWPLLGSAVFQAV